MIKPTLYISGAITGKPDSNRPKFKEATYRLRQKGFTVINPHEICGGLKENQWKEAMKICIAKLMDADVIVLLDDWSSSKGAMIEYEIAVRVGIEVIQYKNFQ